MHILCKAEMHFICALTEWFHSDTRYRNVNTSQNVY